MRLSCLRKKGAASEGLSLSNLTTITFELVFNTQDIDNRHRLRVALNRAWPKRCALERALLVILDIDGLGVV